MTAPVLLLALGLALILAEVLFPSFGVLSVLATAAIVASVALAFSHSTERGFLFLGVTAVLVPLVIVGGFKLFPRSPIGKRMVLSGLSFESDAGVGRDLHDLVGQDGRLETDCRPAGIARIDGRRVDVVTRGEWLEAGAAVRVVDVHGNRVTVASVGPDPGGTGPATT